MLKTLLMTPITLLALTVMTDTFEEGGAFDQLQQTFSATDSEGIYDLGGGRTVQDALNSNSFSYSGRSF